jgi:ATP synthase protein I
MDMMQAIRRQVVILSAGILTLLLIMWFITPYRVFLNGVILGILVSLYNILHLGRRLHLVGKQAITTDGKRVSGLGVINRYLMVTLAIIIIAKYPQYVDYKGFILGLPICYILPLIVIWFIKEE